MRKTLLVAFLASMALSVQAQDDAADEEYELRGNEKYGYIIDKKGEKIEGIVRLMGRDETPWVNQKKVKFIAKTSIDPTRKRQKFTKMDAGDLKEYVAIDDAGKERHFRKIKFTNAREGLMNQSGGGLGGSIKTMKNLTTDAHLAEVLVDGKISMFRLYGYPTPVAVGKGDVERAEQDVKNILDNPDILYQKEDGKVKELKAADIKGLVDDCDAVEKKLAAAEYKTYDPAVQEKKKSGMGKLIKGEMDRGGTLLADMGTEIFTDYNATCK